MNTVESNLLNLTDIASYFPILQQKIHGQRLVYLDNAGTSQKPKQVVEAICQHYYSDNANIHRGVHLLSSRSTLAYEAARQKVKDFIHAASTDEIIFVRGTTEGINLVADSYLKHQLGAGDEVIVTTLEHHSNLVPWQRLCAIQGATLRVAEVKDNAELDYEHLVSLFNARTKLLAIAHISNAFGTVNPIQKIIAKAHEYGIAVLVDGAQAVAHQTVDVQALDCDFYVFSAHKMYGPTGIGVLYAKADKLTHMEPYQTGGGMIHSVRFEHTEYRADVAKFEAGTPHIAGSIGLSAAIDFINRVDMSQIAAHEAALLSYAQAQLATLEDIRIIGTAPQKSGVISFVMDNIHAHDVGTILDRMGIAVRVGHHCAMPAMLRFGVPATVRASFAMYNTFADVDALIAGLNEVKRIFL